MPRFRIWSEFLPAEQLAHKATIALLARYSLEPVIALPAAAETASMLTALSALTRAGLRVGIWPLLTDEQGVWPSESNVSPFCTRVAQALAFAKRADARVSTVAIDLEPPLPLTYRLTNGSVQERGHLLVDALRERRGACSEARAHNLARFRTLADDLHRLGIETLAATIPTVVLDLRSGTHLWQDLMQTPVHAPGWSVVSPMVNTSILAGALPSRWRKHAHVFVHRCGRHLVRALGDARAGIGLGVVGMGKQGRERSYGGPAELQRDVASARAAGIDDIALFGLDGVLAHREPETWLDALTRTAPRPPSGVIARLGSLAIDGAGLGAMTVARLLE